MEFRQPPAAAPRSTLRPMTHPELLSAFRTDPFALLGKIPGVWPVWKPPGPTSHDLVLRARRALGEKRVGHAGTLDPMAEGVLALLAGGASRLFDEFQAFPKRYRARLRWGLRTDTQDAAGRPLADWRPARDPAGLTAAEVEAALGAFRGDILQTPPMYSALKRGGRPLHRLARAGLTVERAARPARAHEIALTVFDAAAGEAEFLMAVASGFYVRTFIDDLGLALGVGATMTALTREAVGPFDRSRCLGEIS